jgi:hypothetical protein
MGTVDLRLAATTLALAFVISATLAATLGFTPLAIMFALLSICVATSIFMDQTP